MNDKLNEVLLEGEKLLWSGKPTMKMLDETHKNVYAGKAVLTVFGAVAFLMYYMLGVTEGTIPFKAAVLVLLAVLMGVILAPDRMDVGKLNKAVYGVTDRRLLVLVNGAVHAVAYDKIDAYKFETDKDGQTSLLCGESGMKVRPSRRRLNTIFGLRMTDDCSMCDRFVMYGIPEADKVEKLVNKYVK
ncbi:MAG: hypothetical protein IJA67_05725 [Oscillospiraceae bacterium]|nr:hypothetical protein [Oscillospiraceae bacterium]